MKIPKHLLYPGISEEQKKNLEEFVNKCREAMREAPTFESTAEATKAAVLLAKKEQYSFPSVWKEPQDIGEQHAVVHTTLREKAQNAGYTEEVDEQKIFDMAKGEVEEIDEV